MKTLLLSITLLLNNPAHAYKGEISFSPEEVAQHQAGIGAIMASTSSCLKAELDYHQSFHAEWKISPFYGDQSDFARRKNPDGSTRSSTPEEKRRYLRAYKRYSEKQIDHYLKITKPTSCIGLVLRCLGAGFKAAGQDAIWAKLRQFTMGNHVDGGALQEGLQKLGWRLLYWNPDTTRNAWFDQDDKRRNPDNKNYIWGKHALNWGTVRNKGLYLYNRVDDQSSLVNFGERVPDLVRNVPFFLGVAHMGYHVFPGSYGRVVEAHSTRALDDFQSVEASPFNPLANGGGPRGFYRSGLIALPPGY